MMQATMATVPIKPAQSTTHHYKPKTVDPKASVDYTVKPIFAEPQQLYGREAQQRQFEACFRRLMDDDEVTNVENSSGSEVQGKEGERSSPIENSDRSSTSSDEASECSTELFRHRDSLGLSERSNEGDDSKTAHRQFTRTRQPKQSLTRIRHSVIKTSDISIKYESSLFCHAPLTRECILLYGPQGVGKRSLVQHTLGNIATKRGGWFLRGEFERDYFGGAGRSSPRNKSVDGKARGVRFEDEKSNDDGSSSSGVPLSGVISVCQEICSRLLQLRSVESKANLAADKTMRRASVRFNLSHLFHDTAEKFKQSLSVEERMLLINCLGIPELKSILIMEDTETTSYYETNIENVVHHKKKLHYAFQKFISVICQLHGPLVICFNNFQYADDASLHLLESLLFDREIGRLMIIGCVQLSDSDSPMGTSEFTPLSERISKKLHSKVDHWRTNGGQFGLNVTDVELQNLCLDSTKQVLVDMLSVEDHNSSAKHLFMNAKPGGDNITSLADLCYEYSHGNTYFLKRFLEILYKKKLLYMNPRSGQWTWDLYDVTSVITSSNIVDIILSESALKLPKQAKSLLLLATCMGSTCIDEDLLFRVWSKFERKSRSNADFQSQFRLFINESIYRKVLVKVEQPSAGTTNRAYHWAHESMIKALCGHVDAHNIASLRYEIGSTLEYSLAEEADLLVVAKLINSGGNSLLGSLDSKKRVKWAEMNLKAARQAVQMSAFDCAAQFAEAGIEFLPSSKRWKDNCKLMLELASILGEVAGALGNSRLMEKWCEEIICRKELRTCDKMRAYLTLVANMSVDDPGKAVSLCLSVLKKMDCTFNREAVTRDAEAFTSCIEETRVLKKEEFLAKINDLPRMDDREKIQSVKLLCRLCQFYVRQSKPAYVMSISRAARWTYHYGLSAESPIMFAYLGLAYVIKEEFRVGAMNGEAALALLSNRNNQSVKVKAHFVVWYMVMPWSRHVRDSSRPLLAAYNFGLQSGDIESAMTCLFGKLIIDLISGRSLLLIEQNCRAVVPQMEEAEVNEIALLTRVLWQTVLNLIGEDENLEDPTLLDGKAFNETKFIQDPKASSHIKTYLYALKSYLCLFTGEYSKGAELALERGNKFIESVPGAALGLVDLVSRGIPMMEMTKRTKKKIYTKSLNDIKTRSKTWSSKGVCSRLHLECLLEAEQFGLDGKLDEASDSFKKGMTFASRAGFAQDVALINNRYASFLLSHNLSEKEAEYHFDSARASYERWGARPRMQFDELQTDFGSSTKSSSQKNLRTTFLKKGSSKDKVVV